jgi:hypothetical protein
MEEEKAGTKKDTKDHEGFWLLASFVGATRME